MIDSSAIFSIALKVMKLDKKLLFTELFIILLRVFLSKMVDR